MELMDTIRARRSARAYRPDPIPEAALQAILEAGQLAPSGGNKQNWAFGVVTDPELKQQLAKASGGQAWIASAPVVLALCADTSADLKDLPAGSMALVVNQTRFGQPLVDYLNVYPDRRAMRAFFHNADVMTAGQQMFLAAVAHGLRACWIGFLDIEKASRLLDLPETMGCFYLMPIGYPAADPEPIERKPLESLVFRNTWQGGE